MKSRQYTEMLELHLCKLEIYEIKVRKKYIQLYVILNKNKQGS